MSGYHIKDIIKGEVGELSKIYEEIEELKDSEAQGIKLMILLELSDVVGAISLYLEKHHSSVCLDDLIKMSTLTHKVFKDGYRK